MLFYYILRMPWFFDESVGQLLSTPAPTLPSSCSLLSESPCSALTTNLPRCVIAFPFSCLTFLTDSPNSKDVYTVTTFSGGSEEYENGGQYQGDVYLISNQSPVFLQLLSRHTLPMVPPSRLNNGKEFPYPPPLCPLWLATTRHRPSQT